jgi:hypothetical protein
LIQRKRYESGNVHDARVADEIADTTVKMQTQLLPHGVLVIRQTVDVAAVSHEGEQLVAVLTGEHSPSHFDIAVVHQFCRWGRRWLR